MSGKIKKTDVKPDKSRVRAELYGITSITQLPNKPSPVSKKSIVSQLKDPNTGIPVRIFLSYARTDTSMVDPLYHRLAIAGFHPWMDQKDILPGERWESAINRAIRDSGFFLACLSANSVNRRGMIQKEIKKAIDIWTEKLESDIYLIPVRLEVCEVPESLNGFQWVDLFEENGWTKLLKAIQMGVERRKH